MPAKTVFRPVESSELPGLFVDHSFEQNLLREGEKRERPKVTLRGTPLCATLGDPVARVGAAGSGGPEGHPEGGLLTRKGIIASGHPKVIPADQLYAVCQGTIYRILGVTDKEAAFVALGIAAAKPQSFPIERFRAWLGDRFVYAVVSGQVYGVVSFTYPETGSPSGSLSARR